MTWPVKHEDNVLANGNEFAPHEGLGDLNKAQWEEPLDPAGFSPNDATFKGGATQPMPPKTGKVEDDFRGSGFTELTGKRVDLDDTPRTR